MGYSDFHRNLLGIDPQKTPAAFWVTPLQEKLYMASEEDRKRGYLLDSSATLQSWEHFLATFVVAYSQARDGRVVFAVSAATHAWTNEQLKKVARRIFSTRAGADRASIQVLYNGFARLSIGSNVLRVDEPPRWVAYGFHDNDVLPPWMRGRLLVDGR